MRPTTDEEGKVYCKEMIPDMAGTFSGTCVIIGGGKTMWDEFEEVKALGDYDRICVNVAGMFIPNPVRHLFSWHAPQISAIKKFRMAEMPGDESLCHSVRQDIGIDVVWYLCGRASTSGLSAIDFAFLLGYQKYILCGVPMDASGYFYKPTINHEFFDRFRHKEVHDKAQQYPNKIRSMSGFTKEIFGYPTKDWL